jgi:pimeloyl-ACP methyl ester carboxylesterase
MSDIILMGIVYVILITVFWLVQLRTGFFSTRYLLQNGLLFLLGFLGLYLAARVVESSQWSLAGIVVLLVAISLYHIGLSSYKFFIDSDNKYRWIHKANRAIVGFDNKHRRFKLTTEDSVVLQVVELADPLHRSEKAVIVCHGAARSKNSIPLVQTCEILATKYDVFTFDFRGHMESTGTFTTDGRTELDLKTVIEHVKSVGYRKIAVFGWSIGAWTALLSASCGRHIDAVIAGAPVPVKMSELIHLRLLRNYRLLQAPVLAGFAVIRNTRYIPSKYAANLLDSIGNMPHIPILLIHNDYDYTLRMTASAFDELYEKLPPTKERMVLPGKGHLFDWPNTYFLWVKMMDWLATNL